MTKCYQWMQIAFPKHFLNYQLLKAFSFLKGRRASEETQRALRLEKPDYTSSAPQSSIQTQRKPKAKQKKRAGNFLGSQYLKNPKVSSCLEGMLRPETLSFTMIQRCSSPCGIHSLEHSPRDKWLNLFFQNWKKLLSFKIQTEEQELEQQCPTPLFPSHSTALTSDAQDRFNFLFWLRGIKAQSRAFMLTSNSCL